MPADPGDERLRLPRRDWRAAWSWMRWDIPTRVALLIAAPLIWVRVAGIHPEAIGLRLGLSARDWLLVALWSAGVALVALTYRRWLWPAAHAPDRSALTLELPFFALVNPVAEELFFRGGVLFGLASLVGMPWSIAITSLVFGLHHGLVRGFPSSFLILGTLGGGLFGIAAASFGSVVPAIILHAAADLAIFVAGGLVLERLQVGVRLPAVASGRSPNLSS